VVEATSALGYRRIYATVRIGEAALMARIPEGVTEPALGETVGVEVNAREIHLFDAGDGTSLLNRSAEVVDLQDRGAAASQ
jgi:hypothetical protein